MKCKGTDVEMKYKGAVFFDYDGTMADDRIGIHLPTETTKKALKSLSENGYMVVLNSGRSKAALMETGIDFDGYVLMNGAYAEVDGKCVFENAFNEKLKVPEDLKLNFNYEIQRRDIDTNGHVNNLNYIDFALETLDEKIYNSNTFLNLEVIYKKEIKLHEKINCYYSFENDKHIITIKSEDNETVHSVVKLY